MLVESTEPIFIRIKEWIKDEIMAGVYQRDELILSTTQLSKLYAVNPATAVKSVSLLQDEGIVYKKRGIGMCVTEDAREKIVEERTRQFYEIRLPALIDEAKKIGIGKTALIEILKEAREND